MVRTINTKRTIEIGDRLCMVLILAIVVVFALSLIYISINENLWNVHVTKRVER